MILPACPPLLCGASVGTRDAREGCDGCDSFYTPGGTTVATVASVAISFLWGYETLKHRNFACVLAIVAPEASISSMKRWVESLSHDGAEYDISKIQIQYIAEETI